MRSAVAGSERLKRRVYEATGLQEVFNDNNKHISLKSSPDKTVPALSPLAEKEGIVVKLNDTGSWRRRHALLVPHTFLYYFGENTAATDLRPHGVIDLELYTDIKVVDGNVVRLAPEDDNSPIRTFYLRLPSKEEAEGWADTIRGTRFVSVREERDALRSAKTVLTEQIAILVETLKESRDSLEASHCRETAAVSELAHSNAKEARCAALVRALAASACDAGEERRWSEARAEARAGQRWGSDRHLVDHIEAKPGGVTLGPAVCALSELAALEEAVSERVREVAALKRANETLRESASAEAEHRREQEAAALNLRCQEHERVAGEAAAREEVEAEVQALRVELEATRAGREEARANLGVVAAACREAEAKARELQEHRRVLAREVKASRAEQRRLSAALACATRAATAAAATAAAATAAMATASASASNATAANANAADANATAGNAPNVDGGDPSRSPSSAGSLAGDGARKVEVARGSRRIGGGGGEIEGVGGGGSDAETDVGDEAGGERYHGEGDDACVGSSPARDNGGTEAGQKNKTERAEVLGPTPTRDSVEPGDAESSSSSVDGTRGPVPAGVDDKGDILSSPSPQLRPPPLDLLRTPLRGSEGGVGGESGATSPEAGSPGLPEGGSGGSGSVSGGSCGSGGGGGSCGISGSSGRRRESEWNPLPSPSSDTQAISPVGRGSCGSVGAKTPGWSKVGVGGGGGDNGKEGHGREMTGRAEEVVAEDGALTVDRRSLCIATGVGESVGAGARRKLEDADRALPAGSPSEADLVGESSRFVNQMVQIFSDGLRESTRTRRTPLLGSLDAGSDADDATKEVEKEEGGDVTDGVDRDSRPFATPKEEEREEKEKEEGEYGAWSAWSTVVVSCDGPVAVAVKEESGARAREGAVCAESLSRSGGVGREEEGSRSGSSPDGQQQSPSKDTGDGTGSVAPTDSTDDHNPPAAAILMGPRATATITESELGAGDSLATSSPVATLAPAASTAIDRQDSLEAAANETAAAGVTQPLGSPADWLRKVGRPDQGWPPLHEESGCSPTPYPLPENGNSCRGSGDGNAAAAAAVAAATAAAAAAAAAAAERGGRVSSEAAAAARRWEAKLKGSLMSMTEGVRWGMGPQRLNGVPDANEH